jgi:hypothetical protein
LDKLATIEAKRKEALASINIKYASADKVKTTFGYFCITFLSSLWAIIIINDLAKLLNECYKETKDLLKERRVRMENKRKEIERQQVTIELDETDEQYSQDLMEKLME